LFFSGGEIFDPPPRIFRARERWRMRGARRCLVRPMIGRIGLVPQPLRSVQKGTAQAWRHEIVSQDLRAKVATEQGAPAAETAAKPAAPQAAPHQELTHREEKPRRALIAPDGNDPRLALMRKLLPFLDDWRKCPAVACRRHRRCASAALECETLAGG